MTWKRPTPRSIAVAVFAAVLAPVIWFAVFAETWKTPPISGTEAAKMTPAETESWIRQNAYLVSFSEHLKDAPGFVSRHWFECASASGVVFVVMVALAGLGTAKGRDDVYQRVRADREASW